MESEWARKKKNEKNTRINWIETAAGREDEWSAIGLLFVRVFVFVVDFVFVDA